MSHFELKKFTRNLLKVAKKSGNKFKLPEVDVSQSFKDFLNDHIGSQVQKSSLETRLKDIVRNAEEIWKSVNGDETELLLYTFLEEIFKCTKQIDRQYFFDEMLDIFYQLSQEGMQPSKCLNRDIVDNLVKTFLPHIKLKLATEQPFQEEGALSEFPLVELLECIQYPNFLREDCYQIVKNKIGTCEYELISYELIPVNGGGFLGNYSKLKVLVKHEQVQNTLEFFVKYVITTEDDGFAQMSQQTYKKEVFLYREFIPKLKSLGVEDLLNFAPTYYFSRTNDLIVLEDMVAKQFSPADIKVPATYDWLVMVIKKMTNYHACSLIFDAKMSAVNGQTIKNIYDYEYIDEIVFPTTKSIFALTAAKTVLECFLPKFTDIPTKLSFEDLKEKISIQFDVLFTKFVPSEEYINVICQRDMWGGNILSKETGHCVFVDYQMITYCPPVVDLLYMIYMNTDRATRARHMDELINLYYYTLKKVLAKYELDLDNLCPYSKYLKMIKEFKIVLLLQTLCLSQVVLNPIMKEIKSDQERSQRFYTADRSKDLEEALKHDFFKMRIRDLLADLYEIIENN